MKFFPLRRVALAVLLLVAVAIVRSQTQRFPQFENEVEVGGDAERAADYAPARSSSRDHCLERRHRENCGPGDKPIEVMVVELEKEQ